MMVVLVAWVVTSLVVTPLVALGLFAAKDAVPSGSRDQEDRQEPVRVPLTAKAS